MIKIAFTCAIPLGRLPTYALQKVSCDGIVLHYEVRKNSVLVLLGVPSDEVAEEVLRKAHAELAEPLRATLGEAKRWAEELVKTHSTESTLAPLLAAAQATPRPNFVEVNCCGYKFVALNDQFGKELIASLVLAGIPVRAEASTQEAYDACDLAAAIEPILAMLAE